jgi:hypothetical protein
MTEQQPPVEDPANPPTWQTPPPPPPPPPSASPYPTYPAAPPGAPVAPAYGATGQVGEIRSTGTCILLYIVTFGIYGLYWYYKVHEDMKRHSGTGLGGGLALVLAFFIGFVMPFITASEIGELYERRGQEKPVSGATGLWVIPGFLIIVGPIVWFVKVNGALNDYWRSLGAVG